MTTAAAEEGYGFVRTLWAELENGANRFDGPGALLLGAWANAGISDAASGAHEARLVGVGGVAADPYLPEMPREDGGPIGRIRHVYVLPQWQRAGAGSLLMRALIGHASGHFSTLTLRTLTLRTPTAHGDRFYRALGFSGEPRFAQATHWLILTDG